MTCREVAALISRKSESKAFSIRTLDIKTLRAVVNATFGMPHHHDDGDGCLAQQQGSVGGQDDETSKGPIATAGGATISAELAAARLGVVAAIATRLPVMFQCHAEVSASPEFASSAAAAAAVVVVGKASTTDDAAAVVCSGTTTTTNSTSHFAPSSSSSSSSSLLPLHQIIEAVLSRVFCDETLDALVASFTSVTRALIRSLTATAVKQANDNEASSSTTAGGGGGGVRSKRQQQQLQQDVSNKANSQQQALLLRGFCNGATALFSVLTEHGPNVITDMHASVLLDTCVSALTAHANRDNASAAVDSKWKEQVFVPALHLLHGIRTTRERVAQNLPRLFLSSLHKTPAAATTGVFPVFGVTTQQQHVNNPNSGQQQQQQQQQVPVTLSCVAAVALACSMPLPSPSCAIATGLASSPTKVKMGLLNKSSSKKSGGRGGGNNSNQNNEPFSSISIVNSPSVAVNTCQLAAREWAQALADELMAACYTPGSGGSGNDGSGSSSSSSASIAVMFALSEKFCDDLCTVLSTGVAMLPMWDSLVREYSAILVRRAMKDVLLDEKAAAAATASNSSDSHHQDPTTSTTTADNANTNSNSGNHQQKAVNKTMSAATAEKLRAHVVNVVGKLALAVGGSSSSSSSSSRHRQQQDSATHDHPLLRSSSAGSGDANSKWIGTEQFTMPWKQLAQGEVADAVAAEAENSGNSLMLDTAPKSFSARSKANKKDRRRHATTTVSSSSSDEEDGIEKKEKKQQTDAAQLVGGGRVQQGSGFDVPRSNLNKTSSTTAVASTKQHAAATAATSAISTFAFSDNADISSRVQFVRFHALTELAHEYGPLYFSARQYHLAQWANRVRHLHNNHHRHQHDDNNNNDNNNGDKAAALMASLSVVPYRSLFTYDPIRDNAGARVSPSSDLISAMSMLYAEDAHINAQMPDSVMYPRNHDMFLRLILSVFSAQQQSSSSSSALADVAGGVGVGGGGGGGAVGWDAARKSALKIISKVLAIHPTLIGTAWSLVRRSLHSTNAGLRSAVIPLLVSLLRSDEIAAADPTTAVSSSSQQQGYSPSPNTKRALRKAREAEEEEERMTSSMFTALVLACNDQSTQVQVPAVNALCDILEHTSSYFSSFTSSSASSSTSSHPRGTKLLKLFQSDTTLERFSISRLIESVMPMAAATAAATTTTSWGGGGAAAGDIGNSFNNNINVVTAALCADGEAALPQQQQQQQKSSITSSGSCSSKGGAGESVTLVKLRARVCKMFIFRWFNPLIMMFNSSSSSTIITTASSSASSSALSVATTTNNNNVSAASSVHGSLMAESHMSGIRDEWMHLASFGLEAPYDDADTTFRSTVVDQTAVSQVHPLTLVVRIGLVEVAPSIKNNVQDALQRVVRFCLRPWLIEHKRRSNNNNNNNSHNNANKEDTEQEADEDEDEDEDDSFFAQDIETGKLFAAIRRVGDAFPDALSTSFPIFLCVLDGAITTTTVTAGGGGAGGPTAARKIGTNDNQSAMQVIHACDVLRAVMLLSSTGGVIELDRLVQSLLAVLLRYDGSYPQRVIASTCRCISAVLSVGDRVGNVRHVERVFRVFNQVAGAIGACAKGLLAGFQQQNQKQNQNQSDADASAKTPKVMQQDDPVVLRKIGMLTRYMFLMSSILRCHDGWASRSYPSLRTLDTAPAANILSGFSADVPSKVALPTAAYNILCIVNDIALMSTTAANDAGNDSNISPAASSAFSKLHAVTIRCFGSLCMLDAATYIRKCESILHSAIRQAVVVVPSSSSCAVAVQAVQALTDFLVDEEARIRSALAEEKQQQMLQHAAPAGATSKWSGNIDDMLGQDHNSGLGPWILQQFWSDISPLLGSPSAALQVVALSFCRVACSQGLGSPVTFLPALVFGSSHSVSAHDKAASVECLKSVLEHHEDTMSGQIAPAVIRCFDFLRTSHQQHHNDMIKLQQQQQSTSSSTSSSRTSDLAMVGASLQALFVDVMSFESRHVYSLMQQRGKKRRDAFITSLLRMVTSMYHQEQWLRSLNNKQQQQDQQQQQQKKHHQSSSSSSSSSSVGVDAAASADTNTNTNTIVGDEVDENVLLLIPPQQQQEQQERGKAQNGKSSSSSSSSKGDADPPALSRESLFANGRALQQLILFVSKYIFSLPMREASELQLVLRFLEQSFHQLMESSIAWAAKAGDVVRERSNEPQQFSLSVGRALAAIMCVELHSALMASFGISRARLEKWERAREATSAAATTTATTTSARAPATTTKAEKAIGRCSAADAVQGAFEDTLRGVALQIVEPLFAAAPSADVDVATATKMQQVVSRLHSVLESKSETMNLFLAGGTSSSFSASSADAAALLSSSAVSTTAAKKTKNGPLLQQQDTKKKTAAAAAKKKAAVKQLQRRRRRWSSSDDDDDDDDTSSGDDDDSDDSDDGDDDDSSSCGSSESESESESEDDDSSSEEEEDEAEHSRMTAASRKTTKSNVSNKTTTNSAAGRRRGRSVTPKPVVARKR